MLIMLCNIRKTVCMVFAPKCPSKVILWQFPKFMVRKQHLEFTAEFKYLDLLGHIHVDFYGFGLSAVDLC